MKLGAQMRTAAADVAHSVVSQCVCLCVCVLCMTESSAKTAEPMLMLFWLLTRVGTKYDY